MNMFKKLPYFVILQGKKYKINVDFRIMINYEKIVMDKKMKKEDQIKKILQSFYPDFSTDNAYRLLLRNLDLYKQACDKLIWFYTCGGRIDYHKKVEGISCNKPEEIYSYEYDDEYIWGAFWDRGYDLTVDQIHWWKFKSLWNSMSENVTFEKIKSYRAYSGKDEQLNNLKEYWSLPVPIEEQERLNKLYELLK